MHTINSLSMSSARQTEAGFIQESQNTADVNGADSALFYLFQEVSKLASPTHNSCLDSNPSSKWLKDTSKRYIFNNKKEEEDEKSRKASSGRVEDCLVIEKDGLVYNNVSTRDTPQERSSPWKVLNLINLHCERLLQKDVELNSTLRSSTKSCHLMTTLAVSDVRDGVQRNSVPVGRQGLAAFTTPDLRLKGSGDHRVLQSYDEDEECGVRVQTSEKTGPGTSKLQKDSSSESLQPLSRYRAESSIHTSLVWSQEGTREDHLGVLLTKKALHGGQSPDACPNTPMTFGSNSNVCTDQSNANMTLPTFLLPAHSETFRFDTTDSCRALLEQGDKFTTSKPGCSKTLTEEKSPAAHHLKSSSCEPATSPSDVWVLQTDLPPAHQRRPRTRRKQPCPSRSADIQDPDFQGVTFRIDTELDGTRGQSRLLITSKYSKELCKRVRKPKLRTRTAQKSVKSTSSEEDNDLAANAMRGKVCASCCTRKTPMWRDAEDGTPLCNACGIRYKKYRVRCVKCWHIPRKESNSSSICFKCGNSVKVSSAQRKQSA
ncbi:GATA-type zinc finger protein 1 isoform X1 [Nothobranchius furzeri]